MFALVHIACCHDVVLEFSNRARSSYKLTVRLPRVTGWVPPSAATLATSSAVFTAFLAASWSLAACSMLGVISTHDKLCMCSNLDFELVTAFHANIHRHCMARSGTICKHKTIMHQELVSLRALMDQLTFAPFCACLSSPSWQIPSPASWPEVP